MKDKQTKVSREWYDWIKPALGVKWGATVTLVGYTYIYHRADLGVVVAAGIVCAFMLLEWTQLAWQDFKRRV